MMFWDGGLLSRLWIRMFFMGTFKDFVKHLCLWVVVGFLGCRVCSKRKCGLVCLDIVHEYSSVMEKMGVGVGLF